MLILKGVAVAMTVFLRCPPLRYCHLSFDCASATWPDAAAAVDDASPMVTSSVVVADYAQSCWVNDAAPTGTSSVAAAAVAWVPNSSHAECSLDLKLL